MSGFQKYAKREKEHNRLVCKKLTKCLNFTNNKFLKLLYIYYNVQCIKMKLNYFCY